MHKLKEEMGRQRDIKDELKFTHPKCYNLQDTVHIHTLNYIGLLSHNYGSEPIMVLREALEIAISA